MTVILSFRNGSFGSINYLANGGKSFPKERIDLFYDSSTVQIDNFRTSRGYNVNNFKKFKTMKQDKGHYRCISNFVDSIENGGVSPINFEEIYHSSKLAIEIANKINS